MDFVKIAMWSGPRNISTALMRSFENRDDTFVTDEPLYGHYLKQTKIRAYAFSFLISAII